MKKYFWLIVFVIIVIICCGSIMVLPRFLYTHVIQAIERSAPVRLETFERVKPGWRGIRFQAAHIVFGDTVLLECDDLFITYSFSDVRRSVLPLMIKGADCIISPYDKEKDFFGIRQLQMQSIDVRLDIERSKKVVIHEATGKGDFGRLRVSGLITQDRELDIASQVFIDPLFLEELSVPDFNGKSRRGDEIKVAVTLSGEVAQPDISIVSDLFELHLEGSK